MTIDQLIRKLQTMAEQAEDGGNTEVGLMYREGGIFSASMVEEIGLRELTYDEASGLLRVMQPDSGYNEDDVAHQIVIVNL